MSSGESGPVVHVVAAAVMDAAGHVLIAQRPPGKHLAGGWEFPGGKLEPGEERAAGLARELKEELGITIAAPRPLIRVQHAYPSRTVLLDMWVVKRYEGEPQGLDGQALRWCAQDNLPKASLLPADKPIVGALRLPERLTEVSNPYYSVVDLNSFRRGAVAADSECIGALCGVFCNGADEAFVAAAAGADFLALRVELAAHEIARLGQSLSVPLYTRGVVLESAWALGASGLNDINH